MSRSVDVSGRLLLVVFEAVSLAALVVFVGPAVWPPEDAAGVAGLGAFALAVVALVAAMWRSRSADAAYLDSGYDVAYDPVADPGQAAKQRWRRAVDRLPGNGEDGDEDGE